MNQAIPRVDVGVAGPEADPGEAVERGQQVGYALALAAGHGYGRPGGRPG